MKELRTERKEKHQEFRKDQKDVKKVIQEKVKGMSEDEREEFFQGLKEKYIKLRESEVELARELREKYGEGEFDITTGTFTPKK